MKHFVWPGALVLSLSVGTAFADLISLGAVSLSGQGLGSVNTVLTMQSPGSSTTESGCVGAGIGGITILGSSVCPGNGPNGNAVFTGGDEQAINNVFSVSSLGLTDFNNLRIIFNANEPSNDSIVLDNLSLTLWEGTTGSIVDARYIGPGAITFSSTAPGTGNAGFGFKLDTTQAGVLNGILASNSNLFLGLAAVATDAAGGLETFSIGAVGGTSAVPEPAVFGLIGLGLCVLALRKRFKS